MMLIIELMSTPIATETEMREMIVKYLPRKKGSKKIEQTKEGRILHRQ